METNTNIRSKLREDLTVATAVCRYLIALIAVLLVLVVIEEVSLTSTKSEVDRLNGTVAAQKANIERLQESARKSTVVNTGTAISNGVVCAEYAGEFRITAYCTEKRKHICGTGTGITSSGQPVQSGVSVATGDLARFPYGTVLYIEGVGIRVVQDTGGAVGKEQFDVAMGTHEEALEFGRCQRKVYVLRGVK